MKNKYKKIMESSAFVLEYGPQNANFIKNETDVEDDGVDICRLCLAVVKLLPVKNITNVESDENFKFIEMELNFQLPNEVCENCWQKLDDILKFIKRCKESHLIYDKMRQNYCNKTIKREEDNETKIFIIENKRNSDERELKDKSKMCNKCGEKVTTFRDHYRLSKNCEPKNHKCPNCSLEFKRRYLLNIHQQIKHDKITFTCDICFKVLTNPLSFKRHLALHQDGKKFMCEICGKSYSRLLDLKDHKNSHSKIKAYKCKICGNSFTTNSSLHTHMKTHHKEIKDDLILKNIDGELVCEICKKTFTLSRALKRHLQSHNENREYQCKQCKNTFDDVILYREHMSTHIIEKKFSCPVCYKRFTTRPSCDTHLLTHKEPTQTCPMCDKKFRLKSHLSRHLALIHNVNKGEPFKCRFCDKAFNVRENLVAHERIHTGEKPYNCHVCDKCFIDSSARKRHVRKVHGESEVENIKTLL